MTGQLGGWLRGENTEPECNTYECDCWQTGECDCDFGCVPVEPSDGEESGDDASV